MAEMAAVSSVQIPPVEQWLKPLAMGGSYYASDPWGTQRAEVWAAMETAFEQGITHFDTASGYGAGQSEQLLGEFLAGRRERAFVASKVSFDEMNADLMLEHVNQSLARLQTDVIDLYYIHWPRQGKDMRPQMEGLETARQQGKIRAIGVSNFSVAQMQQVAEVGRINAHQLGYNLFWRMAETEVIPYCQEHDIAVVSYSSIAQGILAGKFPRQLQLNPNDQRNRIVFFKDGVWPHVYETVEQLKLLAETVERPLTHLAIRWVLNQPGINTAIVGGRQPAQVADNIAALNGDISSQIFEQMTAISDAVSPHIPDIGNMFSHYP